MLWRPLDVEDPTFSGQSAYCWREAVIRASSARFLVLVSVRGWVNPKTIVRLEGFGELKKKISSDLIGIGTRDLPACSITNEERCLFLVATDGFFSFRETLRLCLLVSACLFPPVSEWLMNCDEYLYRREATSNCSVPLLHSQILVPTWLPCELVRFSIVCGVSCQNCCDAMRLGMDASLLYVTQF
jgi:hypothetical protein